MDRTENFVYPYPEVPLAPMPFPGIVPPPSDPPSDEPDTQGLSIDHTDAERLRNWNQMNKL